MYGGVSVESVSRKLTFQLNPRESGARYHRVKGGDLRSRKWQGRGLHEAGQMSCEAPRDKLGTSRGTV